MERVVVGVDGSKPSRRALEWAVREARAHHSTLVVVLAVQPPYLYGSDLLLTGSWEDSLKEAETELHEIVDEVVGDADDVVVDRRVESGDPRRVLRDSSADARMLVVGSRGHGTVSGLLLGSVGQYLVTHAACPVMVVHDDGS